MSGTFSGSVFFVPFSFLFPLSENFSENKDTLSCFIAIYLYLCLKQKKEDLWKKKIS